MFAQVGHFSTPITPLHGSLLHADSHLRKEVGVEVTLHGLRHTQATAMLLAGVPVEVVAERLGHSTATTTQNIYIHLRPQHQQQAAEITETLLKKKPSIKMVEG